jgi:hypothetical protein
MTASVTPKIPDRFGGPGFLFADATTPDLRYGDVADCFKRRSGTLQASKGSPGRQ